MQILKNTEQIAYKIFAQNLLNRNSTPQNIPPSGNCSHHHPEADFDPRAPSPFTLAKRARVEKRLQTIGEGSVTPGANASEVSVGFEDGFFFGRGVMFRRSAIWDRLEMTSL